MEPYRLFSGKGELTPITLKLYIPYSRSPTPHTIIINRLPKHNSRETTVAEAIGFTLYKYIEDKTTPELTSDLCDINAWTLRMVDDGEPDEDFPPLERTQPVTAYIVKKTGRGGRLGARETKLEGEFALVEATPEQRGENAKSTPSAGPPKTLSTPAAAAAAAAPQAAVAPVPPTQGFVQGAPKTGSSKIIRIHISTIDEFAQSVSVCVTSDTFIGEVLEQVCRKKHLDKSRYILRLTGHPNVVWPLERTVSALGDRAELDLVKRKEDVGGSVVGAGTVGSVVGGSLGGGRTPKRGKFLQPVAWTPDMLSSRDYLVSSFSRAFFVGGVGS